MKLGMNIKVDVNTHNFISICDRAGIKNIRLILTSADMSLLPGIAAILEEKEMKAALSVFTVRNENILADSTLLIDTMQDVYTAAAAAFPVNVSLGIVLPANVSVLTSLYPKGVLKNFMSMLSSVVSASSHNVVLPMSFDDATGSFWDGVPFDIVELDMMLSEKMDANPFLESALALINKPFWFGKAGVVGGYSVPSEQIKLIRKLMTATIGAEYSFLWSDQADSRFSWSKDGMFVVDILGSSIMIDQTQRVQTGDPTLASFKAQQRARL